MRALQSEGASKSTLDIYSSAVDRFLDWLREAHGPTEVEKIERRHVEGFLTHLQETRSQSTAHNRYRALKALFNYCTDGNERRETWGSSTFSPMRRMRPPKLEEKPVDLLTPEQVETLWQSTERPGRDFTTTFDDGRIHATFTQSGTFVAVPFEDPSLPSFTGHFAVWGGFNQNKKTVNVHLQRGR